VIALFFLLADSRLGFDSSSLDGLESAKRHGRASRGSRREGTAGRNASRCGLGSLGALGHEVEELYRGLSNRGRLRLDWNSACNFSAWVVGRQSLSGGSSARGTCGGLGNSLFLQLFGEHEVLLLKLLVLLLGSELTFGEFSFAISKFLFTSSHLGRKGLGSFRDRVVLAGEEEVLIGFDNSREGVGTRRSGSNPSGTEALANVGLQFGKSGQKVLALKVSVVWNYEGMSLTYLRNVVQVALLNVGIRIEKDGKCVQSAILGKGKGETSRFVGRDGLKRSENILDRSVSVHPFFVGCVGLGQHFNKALSRSNGRFNANGGVLLKVANSFSKGSSQVDGESVEFVGSSFQFGGHFKVEVVLLLFDGCFELKWWADGVVLWFLPKRPNAILLAKKGGFRNCGVDSACFPQVCTNFPNFCGRNFALSFSRANNFKLRFEAVQSHTSQFTTTTQAAISRCLLDQTA
jgi:hypothetical protein